MNRPLNITILWINFITTLCTSTTRTCAYQVILVKYVRSMGTGHSNDAGQSASDAELLAAGSHATYEQLVEALEAVERTATLPHVREAFLTTTSRIDQLLAFVKSKPFAAIEAAGGYEMNNHGHYGMGDSLRTPALKVLIALTNSSPQDEDNRSMQRGDPHLGKGEDWVQDHSMEDRGDLSLSSSSSSSLWFACVGSRLTTEEGGGLDAPLKLQDNKRQDISVAQIQAQEHKRIRRCLINLIGNVKTLEYLVSLALTKEPPNVGSLAVRLLANLVEGGGDRLRCALASMPLLFLIHHAEAHDAALTAENYANEQTDATAAFIVLGNLLEHPVYPKDRQRGRDLHTGSKYHTKQEIDDMVMISTISMSSSTTSPQTPSANKTMTDGSNFLGSVSGDGRVDTVSVIEAGKDGDSLSWGPSSSWSTSFPTQPSSAPYLDVSELRVQQRMFDIGLLAAIGRQVAFGIPGARLMKAMTRCIFNMVAGKNLLIQETNISAKLNLDNLRADMLRYKMPLEYSAELKYSALTKSALLDVTTIMDMLLWLIKTDTNIPLWASHLKNPKRRMPYPWNLQYAVIECPSLRTDAMAALSALSGSMTDFRELFGHSLVIPQADRKLEELAWKHNSTRIGVGCGDGSSDESGDSDRNGRASTSELTDFSSSASSSETESDGYGDAGDGITLSDESGYTSSDADDEDLIFLQRTLTTKNSKLNGNNNKKLNGEPLMYQKLTKKALARKAKKRNQTRMARVSQRKGRVKRYSLMAIDAVLGKIDEYKKQGTSDRSVFDALSQGLTKEWHLRVIENAIRSRSRIKSVENSNLSSAGLIASVRRLAHASETNIRRKLRASHRLKERTFGRVPEVFPAKLTSVHTGNRNASLVTIEPAVLEGKTRWSALRHSIIKKSTLNVDKFKLEAYTERIYYTVSTYKNPHKMDPLWELLSPEPLMKLMEEKTTYTITLDKNAPECIGISFAMATDLSSGNGVAVSAIAHASQADRARVAGLAVGDLLMCVNGKSVRGAKWTEERVARFIDESTNPLRLTLLGWNVRRFLEKKSATCATRRWFQGCNDSIWVDPAETTFRVVRVIVKHKADIEASDIMNGSSVALQAGSGLLLDDLATLEDAYIVGMSAVTEHFVYNRCNLEMNKHRVYKFLKKKALRKKIDMAVNDIFERGLAPDIRRYNRKEFLRGFDRKWSRFNTVYRCLVTKVTRNGTKISDLSRYYATQMILQLFSMSWRLHDRSQSLTLLDLFDDMGSTELEGKGEMRTRHSIAIESVTKVLKSAIRDRGVGIRGYTVVMHVADLCQK